MMRFILFDIDGTLIDSGGAGSKSLDLAFKEHFGIDKAFSGISMAGKTDLQILREALRAHYIPDTDGTLPKLMDLYVNHLSSEITSARSRHVKPGISALLEALSRKPGYYLGLLTGNLEAGARIKLEAFGMNSYFPIGAFGSDSEDRNKLLPVALERFKARYGMPADYKDCVVIGDTPRDVLCAKPYGAKCIAVATGPYTLDALLATEADLVLPDASDLEEVMGFISSY